MSFILDALRKSETERQRQSTPGLVDAGYRPPARRRGPWLPVLIVVLAANLVLMGYFWMRRDAGTAAVPAIPAVAERDSTPPAVGGDIAARLGADDSSADAEFGAAADLPAVETEPVGGQEQPAGDTATGPATAGQQSEHVTNDLPSAEQLVASGAIPPQTLHLDIHVYSKVPAERFVFINMRKYGEGALLPEGAKIEEITRDGVVLSEAGQRFILTRD